MEHQLQSLFLERNGKTSAKEHTHSREPSATPQDTNINLIRFRLVKKHAMNFRERSHSNKEHEPRQHQVCISNIEALYI